MKKSKERTPKERVMVDELESIISKVVLQARPIAVHSLRENRPKTTLRAQLEKLRLAKSSVQLAVDAAVTNGELIETEVVGWLTQVNGIEAEVERFFEIEAQVNRSMWCPDLFSRFSRGRKAKEMTDAVNFLIGKGFHGSVSFHPSMDDGIAVPQELCRPFTLAGIQKATNNFDRALIIGCGGFGTVYKGYIDDGGGLVPVAIKRLTPTPMPSKGSDFWTEIEMLSRLHHSNLVSLIGYCNDEGEMILVYEYMVHGTLREHLYDTGMNPPLSWEQRLEICIDAARGLDYLHEGAEHAIIHRDVKTTNILLDGNWVPKVSDFGLSKMRNAARTHVTTNVKGTFGYFDPEYFRTHRLTEKSDVYAFGVVLFEVLCGRAAVDMDLEEEQQSLAHWALRCVRNKTLDQIIDPCLKGKIAPKCLRVFAAIASKCISKGRKDRPKMSEVVWSLESALELQLRESTADAAKVGLNIGGAHKKEQIDETILLFGVGNQVESRPPKIHDVVHSCPVVWQEKYI